MPKKPEILIRSEDETHAIVEADDGILREIRDKYAFRPENYMFDKRYKAGVWSGWIRIFNEQNKTLPKGLVPDLLDWAQSQNYSVQIDPEGFRHFAEKIEYDLESMNLPFAPHDYQVEAVSRSLSKKRQIILSPTASGKSFIIYMICQALFRSNRILIVVPTVGLVTQLFSDFKNYSVKNGFLVEELVHTIYSGQEKFSAKPITISTWQSIFRMPKTFFQSFDAVLVDEVHGASSDSLSGILAKCVSARIRVGLTGTLSESKVSEKVLIGHFGPVHRMISTSELMERGTVSNLQIKAIVLKHSGEIPGLSYQDEMDYIVRSAKRNAFITTLVSRLKGNTLVLFQYVEKHGRILEQMFQEKGLNVQFVYGGTEVTDRENVRKIAESKNGVIILASAQIFSTGVSINRLHNIVIASPTKSKIRILQSIGRTLRKHEEKEIATMYDIGDDLRGVTKSGSTKRKPNHTLKHFGERIKIYKAEKFAVKIMELDL